MFNNYCKSSPFQMGTVPKFSFYLMAHLMAQSRHLPARCSAADLWGGTPLSFLFCRVIRQLLGVIALSDGDGPQVFIILNLSQFAISSLISESDSWNMNSAGKIELVGRHPAVVSVLPRYSSIIASYCPFRWGLSPSFRAPVQFVTQCVTNWESQIELPHMLERSLPSLATLQQWVGELATLLGERLEIRLRKLAVGVRHKLNLHAAPALREHIKRRHANVGVNCNQLLRKRAPKDCFALCRRVVAGTTRCLPATRRR